VPDEAAMPTATAVAEALRSAGLAVVLHAGGKDGLGGMKSQFKKADASGARYALVFGPTELAAGQVVLKPLRDAAAEQTLRPLSDVGAWAGDLRTP
jgi:histidyl-tRNA synthetase